MAKDSPLKEFVDEQQPTFEDLRQPARPAQVKAIRYVQRTVAQTTNGTGALSQDDLGKYLSTLFEQGWNLYSVFMLGVSPEGTNILHVLVKYQ